MVRPILQDAEESALLEAIFREANCLVRGLRLSAKDRHFYDDIVQDTMIVVLRNIDAVIGSSPERRRGWIFATMFLVTRNTQRAEIRRTAMWERLRAAFRHPTVRNYFDEDGADRVDLLLRALSVLSDLDRELVIGHAWSGYTATELASLYRLTPRAVQQRITRARTKARRQVPEILSPGE